MISCNRWNKKNVGLRICIYNIEFFFFWRKFRPMASASASDNSLSSD